MRSEKLQHVTIEKLMGREIEENTKRRFLTTFVIGQEGVSTWIDTGYWRPHVEKYCPCQPARHSMIMICLWMKILTLLVSWHSFPMIVSAWTVTLCLKSQFIIELAWAIWFVSNLSSKILHAAGCQSYPMSLWLV